VQDTSIDITTLHFLFPPYPISFIQGQTVNMASEQSSPQTFTFDHPDLGRMTGIITQENPDVVQFRAIPYAKIEARFKQSILLDNLDSTDRDFTKTGYPSQLSLISSTYNFLVITSKTTIFEAHIGSLHILTPVQIRSPPNRRRRSNRRGSHTRPTPTLAHRRVQVPHSTDQCSPFIPTA
jgi:hypothetical protein